jgi:hypothetical protein
MIIVPSLVAPGRDESKVRTVHKSKIMEQRFLPKSLGFERQGFNLSAMRDF